MGNILDGINAVAEKNHTEAKTKASVNRIQFALYLVNPPSGKERDPQICAQLAEICGKLNKVNVNVATMSPALACLTVVKLIDYVHAQMFPRK